MFGGNLGVVSNAADWSDAVYLVDANDDAVDLTGASITLKIRYLNNDSEALSGSTDAGEITLPATGYIAWAFPASSLTSVCAGTYRAGMLIVRDGETTQLFLGTVTFERGF